MEIQRRPMGFQSRLGTTLHSDANHFVVRGVLHIAKSFNPDWAPHFIPTSALSESKVVPVIRFNPDWAPHFIPTQRVVGFPLRATIVSIPTGHHTSFRRGPGWMVLDKDHSFNPDWAPHFIPTCMQLAFQLNTEMFQSRLGTTLHSDGRTCVFIYSSTKVSIPTGHHTSFRPFSRPMRSLKQLSFNPDWAPHFIPTAKIRHEGEELVLFQSRLGTTLHSDKKD